jgi:phosphate starvation-inducible protein PhoH and related proteins
MNTVQPSSAAKRKPKGPIKFNIQLNEEQKEAKDEILANDITVLRGQAGSGKTMLACQVALDMLFKRDVEKIVITRPTVSKEEIGFLPGNMKDKLDPWLAPIYANLYMLYNRDKIDRLLEEGVIEILPFAFMRGRTLMETFVIVDEAQNVTHTQMEMVIGRLGIDSKMVICGDVSQIDLKSKKESGFGFLNTIAASVKGFTIFTLKQNHRHKIVPEILEIYKNYTD